MLVKKRNGRLEELDLNKINKYVERACLDLRDVSASEVVLDAKMELYNKIPVVEINKSLIKSATSKIEKEPNYSFVAARLLLSDIYKEVFGEGVDDDGFEFQYRKTFISNLKKLVKAGILDESLLSKFNLNTISKVLNIGRDKYFKYIGIQILYDRYFLHIDGKRLESPQAFWMRICMGLSINEDDPTEKAIEFYNIISEMLYVPSTPTLFNSGKIKPQLSSCFLNTFDDSIDGIFEGLWQEARKGKYAGGLGFDVTNFRASGDYIKGTNGKSQGLIPWLKIYNDMLIAVNQGGLRRGAGCAYLEVWHLDIEDFIDLRKNTGDDRRRCHDMNTAVWIPDLFIEKVKNDEEWYLFSPSYTKLHELYGNSFKEEYNNLVSLAEKEEITLFRVVKAKDLWKKILTSLFETGHPWISFKDPSNIRYTNNHYGIVHSSNLCEEILLHTIASTYEEGKKTKVGETAVCNLGSLNLKKHINDGKIDWKTLSSTINIAIRMLDNVIDINYYPTEEAKNFNLKHRPVGLGEMGFHDLLYELDTDYDSEKSSQLASDLQEFISYNAILASHLLSIERGPYDSFKGSMWSKGKVPLDSYIELNDYRNNTKIKTNSTLELNWDELREKVKTGMRNSNTMAIAPTATISYIADCSQSIEPYYSVLFVYSNLSGEFTLVNEYFVKDLKRLKIWSKELVDAIKKTDGDLEHLELPQKIKDKYKTVFQISPKSLIDSASNRQIWIDMGQSLNIYYQGDSLKDLNDIYMYAYDKMLKTTYYLRTKAASRIEKSTVNKEIKEELQSCKTGELCESCQ